MKHGKKYQDSVKLIDKQKLYDPREGIEAVLSDREGQVRRNRRSFHPPGC